MIPETLAKLDRDLRRAVETGRYEDVQSLATTFCDAGAAHLKALPQQDPDGRRIACEIGDILDWALVMILTARAICREELNRSLVVNRYLRQPDTTREKVNLRL